MTERLDRETPPAGRTILGPTSDDRRIRVVLADDHALVRAGLAALVNAEPDMRVVGEAADGEAACQAAGALEPDVLVMDLSMPVLGGAEATARIKRDHPAVRVLALTVHEERVYLAQLLRAGAAGYVLKRAAPEDLVRAIRAVVAGGTYIDPAVAEVVVGGFLSDERGAGTPPGTVTPPEASGARDVLSERERTVLQRIARGFSNKEIAAELGVSVKTVETYKARVAEKLDLRSRTDIVRYAAQQGWLTGA
jgi:DNA-binding NarL/FixJ family response regulator